VGRREESVGVEPLFGFAEDGAAVEVGIIAQEFVDGAMQLICFLIAWR
jgi:hypothetical protein